MMVADTLGRWTGEPESSNGGRTAPVWAHARPPLCAGSYGNLARFTDLRRIIKVGDHSLVGAGGEVSDFQQISEYLGELV